MTDDSILLPTGTSLAEVKRLVAGVGLPDTVEVMVEPAHDYPGQQLAIDVYAPTPALLAEATLALFAVLAAYRPQLASAVDRATLEAGVTTAAGPVDQ